MSSASSPSTIATQRADSGASEAVNSAGASKSAAKCSNSLPVGAAVGAILGTGIGCALLTALCMWMFFRFQRKHRSRNLQRQPTSLEKSGGSNRANLIDPNRTAADPQKWQRDLPQSADDATVKIWVKTIFDQVELHVENFYTDSAGNATRHGSNSLSRLDTPYLSTTLENLLHRTRRPSVLIKHCILYIVLARIDYTSSQEQSLLPDEFKCDLNSHPSTSEQTSTKLSIRPQALSQWRLLTAFLRSSPHEDTTFIRKREATINDLISLFNDAFAPFENPKYHAEARSANMTEILLNASQTGVSLFAQPAWFEYEWKSKRVEEDQSLVVITPSFLKLRDSDGRSMAKAQLILEKVLAKL